MTRTIAESRIGKIAHRLRASARLARQRIASVWSLWEAISSALSRRNGVVAAARRRLWEEVRSNPAARPHLRAPWAPWWLGPVRRYPAHAGLLAILLAFVVAVLSAGTGTIAALLCGGADLHACRDGLRGLAWVILAAQVTLLALLFPLVATLVPPLLGSRVSTSARVQLLLAHTEIEAAGASALALAIVGGIGLAFADGMSAAGAIAFGGVLAAWFALNLVGTAWFLARVLGLLTPSGRIAATLAYAASEAWPAEAAPRLADEMLYRALPPDDAAARAPMTFWQSSDSMAAATVTVDLPAPARLVEVRLAVLQAVADAIARRGGATAPNIAFAAPLDLRIGRQCDGTVALAKASVPLTAVERWLIRRAYVFSTRAAVSEPLIGERLLHELATDALDDLRSGNWPVFAERIETLAALHGFLLRLASPYSADGHRHSHVTQLMGWSDLSIGHSWARTHLSLFETAASRLPESRPEFRYLAGLPALIGVEAGRSVPPTALAATDAQLAFLSYRLYDRGAEAAGLATELGGVANRPAPLPDAARDWYDEAWRDLSASWEALTRERAPRPPADAPPERRWAECVEHTMALMTHLRNTADLVAKGAVLGDVIGGGRALDLLLRWPQPFGDGDGSDTAIALDPRAVPPSVLYRGDWTEVERGVPRHSFADGWPIDPTAVFQAALTNAWTDELRALAVVLLEWASEAGPESVAAGLLDRLLRRTLTDPVSAQEAATAHEHAFRAESLLRALCDLLGPDSLRPNLDPIPLEGLPRIRRLRAAPMVSGRTYFSRLRGPRDALIAAAYAPLLVVLAVRAPNERWPTTPEALCLASPSLADDQVARGLVAVAEAAGTVSDDLLRRLAPSGTATDEALRRARKAVRVRCKLIARALRRRLSSARRTAPIDPARLAAIADAAESRAFAKDTAGPPVSLFATVARTSGARPRRFGLRMQHRRGSLTTPLLEAPVGNETDWWAETMRDHVAEQVCDHLLIQAGQRVVADSPEAWRDAVAEGIRRIRAAGCTPLLLYGRDYPARWVRSSDLGAAILERLNVAAARDQAKAHTPFLDTVTIARLPVLRPTLLVPDTLFRRAVFGAVNGRIVSVSFTPDAADAGTGVLAATGSFDLEFERLDLALVIDIPTPPA
jgi:hypothetical protein